MFFDSFSLFGAIAMVLLVMALALAMAGRTRPGELYWRSWCIGNVLLGAGIIAYMAVDHLPVLMQAIVPNGLLVAGFGLRWRAAREFTGRPVTLLLVWGPTALFAGMCIVPAALSAPAVIYTTVNVILAAQAGATAFEFRRDRGARLASQTGLVVAYAAMAISFTVRVGQGLLVGQAMRAYLPVDEMLMGHLVVALLFSVASGSFALAVAYERDAVRLKALAMEDSLTKLLNRGAFEETLRRLQSGGDCGGFAVVAFDVDHFKLVNDRHGHAAGDAVLREFARVCRAALPVQAHIARIGGEEFAAIVPHVSVKEAGALAEAVRQGVKGLTFSTGKGEFSVTISSGICHAVNGLRDFDELMHKADAALYAAKHKGRDRVELAPADEAPAPGGESRIVAMPQLGTI